MVKADVATRRKKAPPPAKPSATGLLRRYWDLLAVVLLMLGSFPTVWLARRTVTLVPNLGLIDDNWHLDSTWKALRGIWIGRDVAFTHGPIFQWLSSIPAHSTPISFGALYATWNTIPIWCAVIFAYITLRLILPEQPPWKRFVLLLLLASFWETSLRSTFPVLLFAVFLRGWYEVHSGRLRSAFAGTAGAVLCAAAFLVAGDVGTYATAAWFICLLAIAVEMRPERFAGKLLIGLASFAATALVLAIVINSFMAGPFNFRFWRDSLAQVAAYRWSTPALMTDQGTWHLLIALLICTAIFLVRAVTRGEGERPITQRTAFLLGGFVFGLAVMQSALVRSDIGHVIIGEFAMIFFASAILFSFSGRVSLAAIAIVGALALLLLGIELASARAPVTTIFEGVLAIFCCVMIFRRDRNYSLIGVVAAVGCSMLFSHPVFRPSSVLRLYGQLRDPMTECPPGYTGYDQACYREPLTPLELAAGASFLSQNSAPTESVFVFPYQTMFGLAARRNVAGGLMQAYTASGPTLSRLEMSGLDGKRIPAALYLPDDDYQHMSFADVARWSRNYLSVPVDGVPNFTRTPEVWFWMLRHYRSAGQISPGVVGLLRDDSRAARIALQSQPLGLSLRTYAIGERSSATDLGAPNWPAGFDFIRLRMTVRYPIWWKLRKPERLQLEITRADGTHDVQWLLVQPNVPSDVWFYAWDGSDLANYFNADESQWRPSSKAAVTNLRLLASPLDWVSVQPESITIDAADAVRVTMAPQP